jgi:hypothetical protein
MIEYQGFALDGIKRAAGTGVDGLVSGWRSSTEVVHDLGLKFVCIVKTIAVLRRPDH